MRTLLLILLAIALAGCGQIGVSEDDVHELHRENESGALNPS